MKILSIDLGTYSIKFYETAIERRKLNFVNKAEIIIDEVRSDFNEGATTEEIQLAIIKNYIGEEENEWKIIFQLPNHYITTRYLDIPVTNKKKAEQIIPFQLEETLPFSATTTHMVKSLYKGKEKTLATIYISPKEEFNSFFKAAESRELLPNYLTCEQTLIENYISENKITGSYGVLDMGHDTTKIYFVHNMRVVSNHTSYIAGRVIDEAIAETYQISREEATIYKHENCFFLTDAQYEDVDDAQREFAFLMKQTFWPFITEMKRWELGYKIKTGKSLDKLYLMGGTSQIKNLNNFISEGLSKKCPTLDVFNNGYSSQISFKRSQKTTYSFTHIMAASLRAKNYPLNFLVGEYSVSGQDTIPLYSTIFIASRSFIFMIILVLILGLEGVLLKSDEKSLDKKITRMLKSPSLAITSKDRKRYKRKPTFVLGILKKKNKIIRQDIKTIMAATKIESISPLSDISKKLGRNKQVDMIYFESEKNKVKAKFMAERPIDLKSVHKRLQGLGLKDADIKYKENSKNLEITYTAD